MKIIKERYLIIIIISICIISGCISSYDLWYAKNPGLGTYRIIEEVYNPKIMNRFGRLNGTIYDAVDRNELVSIIEISSKDTILNIDAHGKIQVDLKEGLYTIKINSFAHYELKTKYIQIRNNYETKMEFYVGADY